MDELNHRLASLFDTLGNGIRVDALEYLQNEGEAFLGEIADHLERSLNSMSRHMKILSDYDLIRSETRGRKKFFMLKRLELVEDCLKIREHLKRPDDEL